MFCIASGVKRIKKAQWEDGEEAFGGRARSEWRHNPEKSAG
jgi:hypothetical protein